MQKKNSKHAGNGKKLIRSEDNRKPIRKLNDLITKSDYGVITGRTKRGGKYLDFTETKNEWSNDAINDCKDSENPDCPIERIQEDQPEYCLMGNPRSCIGKSTIKLLEEKIKGDKLLSRITQEEDFYLSQFDNLSTEEIDRISSEVMTIGEDAPF